MKQEILIIFEGEEACPKLRQALESETISTELAVTLDEAIRLFAKKDFCLVIMDASISPKDAQTFLKTILTIKPIPVLLLSSDTKHKDRLNAFNVGVHAYLGKPYSTEECVAQAKSLIKLYGDLKNRNPSTDALVYGTNLIINPVDRTVLLNKAAVDLTRKEFDLLYLMASHPGQVFSREQLYRRIWDSDYSINIDDSVKAHIKTLRKKLSETEYIQNVWGVGYRFAPQ